MSQPHLARIQVEIANDSLGGIDFDYYSNMAEAKISELVGESHLTIQMGSVIGTRIEVECGTFGDYSEQINAEVIIKNLTQMGLDNAWAACCRGEEIPEV